jgi:plastocyanin
MLTKTLRPAAIALGILVAACGGKKDEAPAGPAPNAERVDQSKAGSVAGRVLIDGAAPANASIKMSADPFCIRANAAGATFETYVVDNGGLENVFVHVKDGLGNYYFDVPTEPVKLDQKGCRYTPHVFGVRTGQPLEIRNSDDTLHNVHALAEKNQGFNYGQAIAGMTNTKTFTAPEVMITFKCDVHAWMGAYAGVVSHPYFAVTKDGGRFELEGLPAGTYTIEAWHEKLGTETVRVTLAEKESKDITFTFRAAATRTN